MRIRSNACARHCASPASPQGQAARNGQSKPGELRQCLGEHRQVAFLLEALASGGGQHALRHGSQGLDRPLALAELIAQAQVESMRLGDVVAGEHKTGRLPFARNDSLSL